MRFLCFLLFFFEGNFSGSWSDFQSIKFHHFLRSRRIGVMSVTTTRHIKKYFITSSLVEEKFFMFRCKKKKIILKIFFLSIGRRQNFLWEGLPAKPVLQKKSHNVFFSGKFFFFLHSLGAKNGGFSTPPGGGYF